jgi:hypothetical protein
MCTRDLKARRSQTKVQIRDKDCFTAYTQHVHVIVLTLLFFCAGNCIKLQRNI